MKDFCSCKDFEELKKNNSTIFRWDRAYGWILHWIELTDDSGFSRVHRYGIPINFCPMCGKILKSKRKI
jgi:hypothetical protein